MEWSLQQDSALKAVSQWLKSGTNQVFRMFGYAGTGKSTLARQIAEDINGIICFGAFTGKAASVMRQKGCHGATTIHSLIYIPVDSDSKSNSPEFELNVDSDVADAELVIIDECSMVDEKLAKDLLSFGVRVLVLGDPAQLPPVSGAGFFTDCRPDIMLTEVHRQAADNPIIRLSMDIRNGQKINFGHYGASKVVRRADFEYERVFKTEEVDQILVGMNKTRVSCNQYIRRLKGYDDVMPEIGEKLVCLRNDKSRGLLNGGIWEVTKVRKPKANKFRFEVISDDFRKTPVQVVVPREFFEGKGESLKYAVRRKSDEFEFGYALTVHKAQGSQWNNIVLFDESDVFREHRERWLYTGITRAVQNITIVR